MNKIIVSIVFAIILVLGINKVTDVIFYVEKPEKSAYQVATTTTVTSTTSAETGSVSSESGNIMALFAKNVRLVTALLKMEVIKLGRLYGACWEDQLVLFQIINIQKRWQHMVKIGHSRK